MKSGGSNKRARSEGYNRRHDRHKFRKTTNATVHRKDLGNNLSGILFSCTPHHENQCFRDAVILLGRHCALPEPQKKPSETQVSDALAQELAQLRSPEKPFTRVEGGVFGSVFVQINLPVDREAVVEAALRDAKTTGSPGSKHCIRIIPVHTTCYAKVEDASKAAVEVAKRYFPKLQKESKVTYAIAFRSRLNSGVHRDEFIPAIASAIENDVPGYGVDLTKPDVTLIVEILKTSCCIGTFRHFHQLSKMNLREAACPSKPKETGAADGKVDANKKVVKDGSDGERPEKTSDSKDNGVVDSAGQKEKAGEACDNAQNTIKSDKQEIPSEGEASKVDVTEKTNGKESEGENLSKDEVDRNKISDGKAKEVDECQGEDAKTVDKKTAEDGKSDGVDGHATEGNTEKIGGSNDNGTAEKPADSEQDQTMGEPLQGTVASGKDDTDKNTATASES